MNSQVFGHTLRLLRNAAGLSLRDMAKRIQVSPAYLCQIELGKQPPPTNERITEIAETIGIPESLFFDLSERPDPRILDLLKVAPELNVLIQSTQRIGLRSRDLLELSALIQKLGEYGFRKLIHYGLEHKNDFLSPEGFPADRPLSKDLRQRQDFSQLVDPRLIFTELDYPDKERLLAHLMNSVGKIHPAFDADVHLKSLRAREDEMSSGLGSGVAVPHLFVDDLSQTVIVLARIPVGLDFDAYDCRPVHFVCLILSPPEDRKNHLNLLAFLARRFLEPGFAESLSKATSKKAILSLLFSDSQSILN